MRCPTAQMLSRYEDELIEGTEREQVRRHVMMCGSCQQVLARYRAETRFIEKTLAKPTLPARFEAELLRKIQTRKKGVLSFLLPMIIFSVVLFFIAFFTVNPVG